MIYILKIGGFATIEEMSTTFPLIRAHVPRHCIPSIISQKPEKNSQELHTSPKGCTSQSRQSNISQMVLTVSDLFDRLRDDCGKVNTMLENLLRRSTSFTKTLSAEAGASIYSKLSLTNEHVLEARAEACAHESLL